MKLQTLGQKYRDEAEKCELNAKRAQKLVDQEAWLRLAEDWTKLARTAEGRQIEHGEIAHATFDLEFRID